MELSRVLEDAATSLSWRFTPGHVPHTDVILNTSNKAGGVNNY